MARKKTITGFLLRTQWKGVTMTLLPLGQKVDRKEQRGLVHAMDVDTSFQHFSREIRTKLTK